MKTIILMLFAIVLFSSCIGVNADIVIDAGNSGTITIEYRISQLLESIGALDGNERWLPVPVGEADFRRSMQRLPGIKMVSFSSRRDSRDLINTVKLQFSDIEALLNFLDPSGSNVFFNTNESGYNNLLLRFSGMGERGNNSNIELRNLFASSSESYNISVKMNLPSQGKLEAPVVSGGSFITEGRTLSFSVPLSSLLFNGGVNEFNFVWQGL